jgi:hypothetical protein
VAQPIGQRWVTGFAKYPAMVLICWILGATSLPGRVDDAVTDAILQSFPWDQGNWIGKTWENRWKIYWKP